MNNAIEIANLTKKYGQFSALNGFSLNLAPGQIVGLMGENGCGKTTLLKILAGVLSDYSGDVLVQGVRPGPATKNLVSFLPDMSFLPDGIRGRVALDMYSDFFTDFDRAKAEDTIGFFSLDLNQRLKEMSKGMREKLQVALAMSRQAKIYLLDEPISGVDPAAREAILTGTLRNFDENSLLLVSTHLISDVENIVDAVVFMRYGKVLISGAADDLREEHQKSLDQLFREVYSCMR